MDAGERKCNIWERAAEHHVKPKDYNKILQIRNMIRLHIDTS